jgi:AcrR family transcriptional regulator
MARPRTVSDDDVVAATGRALNRHGLAGTTLAVVAREVGISPAGLVQRFGSKRELLLAFAARAEDATRACFTAARSGAASPIEALHRALAELTTGVRDRSELANSLGFLQLDLTDEAFRALAAADARRARAEVGALLAEAVVTGELRAGVDTAALARAVHVAYNGVLVLWALLGEAPLPEELRTAVDAVLHPHRPDRPPERGTPAR